MKPALKYADVFGHDKWLQKFNELKDLPKKTVLYAGKRKFILEAVHDGTNHPTALWLSERIRNSAGNYMLRKGDVLIFDLKPSVSS